MVFLSFWGFLHSKFKTWCHIILFSYSKMGYHFMKSHTRTHKLMSCFFWTCTKITTFIVRRTKQSSYVFFHILFKMEQEKCCPTKVIKLNHDFLKAEYTIYGVIEITNHSCISLTWILRDTNSFWINIE